MGRRRDGEREELTSESEAVLLPVLAVVDPGSDDFFDEGLVRGKGRRMVSFELERQGEGEGELDDIVPFPAPSSSIHFAF